MGYPKNRISNEYDIEIIVNKKQESESIGYQKNRKPKKIGYPKNKISKEWDIKRRGYHKNRMLKEYNIEI